ncbi:MAG: transporter [Ponticaulis sp.]|nr:transporter [Ponticaulis sp.]
MLSTFLIVLPIFALIFVGWMARRTGALGPAATREVNRLVVFLALPALLFDIVANATPEEIWQPGFIMAFGGGCAIILILTIVIRGFQGVKMETSAIEALNAGYANTAYMGFPLMLSVGGEPGLKLALIASIITVCIAFAIAIMLIELSKQSGVGIGRAMLKSAKAISTNPIVIAPTLGAIVLVSGFGVPKPAQVFLDLLGAVASPCALIALGLFLADAGESGEAPQSKRTLAALSVLKLAVQPLITWVIAGPILGLSPFLVSSAVLIAALPTGTGPFMLAEFYGNGRRLTAHVVLITTLISVVSTAVLIRMLAFV